MNGIKQIILTGMLIIFAFTTVEACGDVKVPQSKKGKIILGAVVAGAAVLGGILGIAIGYAHKIRQPVKG
jgi:hypothetical protein